MKQAILITGGLGFIGSHFVRHLVTKFESHYQVVNLDKETYAGNQGNLPDSPEWGNYEFVKGDICDRSLLNSLFEKYAFQKVVNVAAESHVDRSIDSPCDFVTTNVLGTAQLLDACRHYWQGEPSDDRCFLQVSTDEVYGSLGDTGEFTEATPYAPRSPYAATKASADHLVRAYGHTYGLPVKLTHCSNNYGPNQYPEKLIPVVVGKIVRGEHIPVYGKGDNVRDWLHVEDHVRALDLVLHQGRVGRSYNVGGSNEIRNIDLVQTLCDHVDSLLDRPSGSARALIRHVEDRLGHDFRYAIDAGRITSELGWAPEVDFDSGIRATARWYVDEFNRPEQPLELSVK